MRVFLNLPKAYDRKPVEEPWGFRILVTLSIELTEYDSKPEDPVDILFDSEYSQPYMCFDNSSLSRKSMY